MACRRPGSAEDCFYTPSGIADASSMATSLISMNEHTPKSKESLAHAQRPAAIGISVDPVFSCPYKVAGCFISWRWCCSLVNFGGYLPQYNRTRHEEQEICWAMVMLNRKAWRLPSWRHIRNTSVFTDDAKSQRSDGRPRTIIRVNFSLRSRTLLNGTPFSVVVSLDYGAWGFRSIFDGFVGSTRSSFETNSHGTILYDGRQLKCGDRQLGHPDSMDLSQSLAGITIMPA
ncbi:uncharacterized protein EV420DRAFT_1748628 [Desarmillaria tabescens]|uniref:Uncharacterized protein n=1 Tax=Armillaria tabescens TaxID=1929756 RepID=A0AA39KCR7_ARMTA|nr:uncharacterized protein EV420DRAFT_1748628 [Desarmillaria tabescens]KAK0457466.1 hypothetical protein EV420DRAFT_1748628 [Desarmillaria tabescens]